MASRSYNNKKPSSERPEERKKRRCLMCAESFVSEHKGHRICQACKSTSAWREGAQYA